MDIPSLQKPCGQHGPTVYLACGMKLKDQSSRITTDVTLFLKRGANDSCEGLCACLFYCKTHMLGQACSPEYVTFCSKRHLSNQSMDFEACEEKKMVLEISLMKKEKLSSCWQGKML